MIAKTKADNFSSASLKNYLLDKLGATEDFPFGPDAAVYRVYGKIFAIVGEENGIQRINLKCDPVEAEQLRMVFDAIIPGYHMNKKHWNTVILNGTVPQSEIKRMIDNSYALVLKKARA